MFALADFSVADFLIDGVGCQIHQIREKVAKSLSGLQTAIRECRNNPAGVAYSTELWWRIDERYRCAIAAVS